MPEQVPSVSRAVHLVGTNGQHYSADICEVKQLPDGTEVLDLFVKDNTRGVAYFAHNRRFDAAGAVGTWHWPEYVAPRPSGDDDDPEGR